MNSQIQEWANRYQNLLSLNHWEIEVTLHDAEEMVEDGGMCIGLCYVYASLLKAHIKLLDPGQVSEKIKNELGSDLDLRSTLLHEMIHIPLELCGIDEEHMIQYEQAVIMLERAILKLEKDLEESSRYLDHPIMDDIIEIIDDEVDENVD